ncbi:MAG: flagellar biosynthesis regulator FlaF [Pseudomonadota bacterium]
MMMQNQSAVAAYAQAGEAVRSDRDRERDAIARVTRMLKEARDSGSRLDTAKAVATQYRLWSMFFTDLSVPGNGLPEELQKQLRGIAAAVLQNAEYRPGDDVDFEFHISVNENIMEGLAGG